MPTQRPLVVANWKAQLAPAHERLLARAIAERLLATPALAARVELILAPSALSLAPIAELFDTLESLITLAAQDCSAHAAGAHTGELTATAIAELADTVILGHAEQRRDQGEAGTLLGTKLARAVTAGLRPLLCFDDPLDAKLSSRAAHFATEWNAITAAAATLGVDRAALLHAGLLLAYEPLGAIGTGSAMTPSAAGEAAATLRDIVNLDLPVLYGGSVVGEGAAAYLAPTDRERRIDGLLVGGASLDPDRLFAILATLV